MLEHIHLHGAALIAVDLTHTISTTTPTWDGSCGFTAAIKCDYAACPGEDKFRVQQFTMAAGIGTHIDAPAHCIEGGKTIDEIGLAQLIAPCMVIDISDKADENYSLSVTDIENFEQQYEAISPHSFVIVRTGWEQYWHEPDRYRNNHKFPSISPEAAELLLKRNIVGIGIDTLSPDRPDNGFPVHRLILGAEKYIVENVANAQQLPATGSTIIILPIKVGGATECPVRMIGFVPHEKGKK